MNIMEGMLDGREDLMRKFESHLDVNEAPEDRRNEEEPVDDPEEEDSDAAVADEPGDGREDAEPEQEEVPEQPDKAPQIEKEYLGHTMDTHYYMVSDQEDSDGTVEDLIVVDQEGVKVYSAQEQGLPMDNLAGFIREVYKDLRIEDIANTVYMKYIYPEQVEAEAKVDDEENQAELEAEEPEKEELPSEEELEDEYPTEKKVHEKVSCEIARPRV